MGTATYEGDAIGNVSRLNGEAWYTYVATGDMDMTWNFKHRTGELHIKNFDGMSFNGNMAAPGNPSRFSGELVGPSAGRGSASGAFVKDSNHVSGKPPPGVIGNFGVQGNDYKASGIFGGALKPR